MEDIMELYVRDLYLKKIRPFYHDDDIIKVLTGVRRCGKSCIMQMIADEVRASVTDEKNIIFINLDKKEYKNIKTAPQLESLIDSLTEAPGLKYLFIDEIQNVKDFEETLNAYREEGDYSIFITGSNSYLLSGELATKLTGRYIEFEIFTLTFNEYLGMKKMYSKPISQDLSEEMDNFILEGGFPRAVRYDDLKNKRTYTKSVINEIFEKDIKRRRQVRHLSVFNRVRDYVINNFGASFSLQNVADYFRDVEKIQIKNETIHNYITLLEEAKIIYRCSRFDMKSRRSLKGEQKYYLADLSFYFALNTDNRINYGPAYENIVYTYARAHDYAVSVGRIGKLECDFIVRDDSMDYAYIQVSRTIADRATEDREYASLEGIKDAYPKYLLTNDRLLQKRSGVLHENIVRFIVEDRLFGFR